MSLICTKTNLCMGEIHYRRMNGFEGRLVWTTLKWPIAVIPNHEARPPRHTSWLNVYQSISRQNITKWRRYLYLSLCWWIGKYKFCIRAKWPIKPELIPASVACSNWEYFYSPLDRMLVQNTAVVKVLYESWAWVSSKYQEKMRGQTLHFLLVSTQ